jgi:hypothetical protein
MQEDAGSFMTACSCPGLTRRQAGYWESSEGKLLGTHATFLTTDTVSPFNRQSQQEIVSTVTKGRSKGKGQMEANSKFS